MSSPSLPLSVREAIEDIQNDHESGARQLAIKALHALQLAFETYNYSSFSSGDDDRSKWMNIVTCARHISQSRPSMRAAIHTAVLRALHTIQQGSDPKQTIADLIHDEETALSTLCQHYVESILQLSTPQSSTVSILTLSNSSTIFAAFKTLFSHPKCPNIILTILESRPLCEGATLATNLLPYISTSKHAKVMIQLATDASAAFFAKQSDVVVFGADQLDPHTGCVKNKIGSLAVATFGHTYGKKVVCVAATDKLEVREDDEEIEENDEKEVVDGLPGAVAKGWESVLVKLGGDEEDGIGVHGLRVRNVYFEWVPAEFVEGYVTELGYLGKNDLNEIYVEREAWRDVWNGE